MTLDWEVLDEVEAVEPIVQPWDELAERLGKPYCSPAWLLAWWRHASPKGARLRIVAVREGDRLVGVAPFYAIPWFAGLWTWSFLGTDTTSRIEPLSEPDSIGEVAVALCQALAAGDPAPARVRLEGIPKDSPWPKLLREGVPGWLHNEAEIPAPTVSLVGGTLDDWLSGRSSNFRQQMRRARRKLEKDGAEFKLAKTPEEIKAAITEFARLHNARWDWRGGSTALTPGTDAMLADVGRDLAESNRFQLLSLVLDGKTINSQLFLAAGSEVSYWNGGFDDDYANYKPSLVSLVETVRTSLELGHTRFDLGPGSQEYKHRFSDSEDKLLWMTLIPRTARYAPARVAFAPKQVRHAVAARMTREQKDRVRELMERSPGTPAPQGNTVNPPVLVLQPSNGGLALARTLARRGIDVEVIATPGDSHTARTRYAKGTVLPNFADDSEAWRRALVERASNGPLVVLAGADEATVFLSRMRSELPDSLLTFEGRDDVHLPLMDKTESHALALASGIKVPLTRSVTNQAELEAVAAEAPYPCVLKPVLTHLWRPIFGHDRVLLAYDADELMRHGRKALGAGLETIVSEYVPGGDDHVEEAILVRAADGSFPMEFGCRKLRQSPSGFGAASLCESAAMPESLAMARTLLTHTGYVGVAGIETKRHADTGEYYFIEANVRLPTQFGLGDAAGAEASWRTYATLAGLPPGPKPEIKLGVRLLFPELEVAELRRFGRGDRGPNAPKSWREFTRGYRRIREVGVLDPRDLGPAVELAGKSLKRRLRRG